jgi:hypothetical protein
MTARQSRRHSRIIYRAGCMSEKAFWKRSGDYIAIFGGIEY